MASYKFKKGDKVTPIEGRNSSNGWPLVHGSKYEILDTFSNSYNSKKNFITVKLVLKNRSSYYNDSEYVWGNPGQTVTMYEDAFRKIVESSDDYEIF